MNAIKANKNFEIAEACISVLFALRSHHRESSERLQSSSGVTNGMSEQLYEKRTKHTASLLPLEGLRCGISSVLDTMIERVETQLPSSSSLTYTQDGFENVDQLNLSQLQGDVYYSTLGLSGNDINVAASQAISRLGSLGASLIGGFSSTKPLLQSLTVGAIQYDNERKMVSEKNSMAVPPPSSFFSDVEMRMKALDRYQLEAFYSPRGTEDYGGLIKEVCSEDSVVCQ